MLNRRNSQVVFFRLHQLQVGGLNVSERTISRLRINVMASRPHGRPGDQSKGIVIQNKPQRPICSKSRTKKNKPTKKCIFSQLQRTQLLLTSLAPENTRAHGLWYPREV